MPDARGFVSWNELEFAVEFSVEKGGIGGPAP